MKVLVIGEPCVDVIHKADGKVYNEHGGISYSIVASAMLDDGSTTVPVIGLNRSDMPYFESLFSQLDSVDVRGIYETPAPVRRVDLFYENENHRWECSTQPIEPTPFEKIEPFLPADGIHLNLISGSDVTLETLGRIRSEAPGCHIHLDLHNVVMRRLPDGRRVRGAVPGYIEWCENADTVQLNEEESEAIDPETGGRRKLAEKILGTRARVLVITMAEKGLVLYERRGREIEERFFGPKATRVVDPTGSGDVFGAAFLHAMLSGRDAVEAVEAGIEMAVRKVGTAGPGGFLETGKVRHNA